MKAPQNKDKRTFLGRGWSFPPTFHPRTISVDMVEEEEDIRQSLFLLISTMPGERIMRPDYGCDLHSLVFERMNANTRSEIIYMVEMAVIRYEPRVTVNGVRVEMDVDDIGMIRIILDYTVRKTNARSNIVYPFYIREGTLVSGR